MARRFDPLKRYARTLFLSAAGACFPGLLWAAAPDAPLTAAAAGIGFDNPLLQLFLCLAIGALLLVAVMKRRHRSELLTVCLALSIVLHLLSLSLFSIVPVGEPKVAAAAPKSSGHGIEIGSPSLRESLVSESIRSEPLKTDRADTHARLEIDRAARNERIAEKPARTQAILPESDVRTAARSVIKTPGITTAPKAMDERLEVVPKRTLEVATIKMAAPQQASLMPSAQPAKPKPDASGKSFDVAPVAPASMPYQQVKPSAPQAGRKNQPDASARAKIELAAVASRQAEVKDAILPAGARATVDRLADRAREIEAARGSEKNDRAAIPSPTVDVKLDKRAGQAPQAADRRMTAAVAAGRLRMASDTLASLNPDRIAQKQNEVGGLAPETAAGAARLKPVQMSGVQPLIASERSGAQGQVSASSLSDQREWTPPREAIAAPGAEGAGEKPQAVVRDATTSKEPVRIGLGSGALAEPATKAPAVSEVVSDASAGRPELTSLGDPAPRMTMVPGEQKTASPGVTTVRPSDLAAVKLRGGLGNSPVAVPRVAPKYRVASQNAGVAAGTLVEGSGGGLQAKDSASAEVKDQLTIARTGGEKAIGAGLADMGAPAQTVEVGARGGSSGEGLGIQPAELASARTTFASDTSAAAGDVERPSPTGRSDLPASQGSFVGQGIGVVAPRAASSAVPGGEQVEAGAPATLAVGDVKALAGRMNIERPQGQMTTGGGKGEKDGGPAELSLGKVGGAAASDISLTRVQASAGGGGGSVLAVPGETLVGQADLQPAGRAKASETAGNESLTVMKASVGATDLDGPAIVAPTAARQGLSGGGKVKEGIAPVGTLQVAKAGGVGLVQLERKGGGGGADLTAAVTGAGERNPTRMDVNLGAGSAKAPVTSDISVAPAGQEGRRSFLSVGQAPNPGSVPQKAIYKMRKPEKRRQFIGELGGTAQTEEAVEQALAWLSRTQSDDGRWDVDGFKTLKECGGAGDLVNEDVSVTGMALLAYLGAGYTHLEGEHKETVRKGLDWLLNCEKENGDLRGAGQMYGQAIATAVLCESYSLTGDERLLAPARRAVQFIVNSQTSESGWRYAPRDDTDTSVTGWQILALKSAQIAGIAVPDQTFRWTELWLDKVRQGKDGGLYSYKAGHAVTPVMTAEGVFCQLFMSEQTRTRGLGESVAYLMKNPPVWDPENRAVHMYYWYYATLSMYLSGAKEFDGWNTALIQALLKGRNTSGPAAGSWDPVCQLGLRGGRVYSTAVGALCLEVYYRFLPLYKQPRL